MMPRKVPDGALQAFEFALEMGAAERIQGENWGWRNAI